MVRFIASTPTRTGRFASGISASASLKKRSAWWQCGQLGRKNINTTGFPRSEASSKRSPPSSRVALKSGASGRSPSTETAAASSLGSRNHSRISDSTRADGFSPSFTKLELPLIR